MPHFITFDKLTASIAHCTGGSEIKQKQLPTIWTTINYYYYLLAFKNPFLFQNTVHTVYSHIWNLNNAKK